jgi:ribosome modulation factor
MTAYQQGYDAYLNGYFHDDNPFMPGQLAWSDWHKGWCQAEDDELAAYR